MWRAAFREHTKFCNDTVAWVGAQSDPFDTSAEPIQQYEASWNRVRPLLANRRGPRLVAESFDRTLRDVVFDVERFGSAVPTLVRGAELEDRVDRLTVHALLDPRHVARYALPPVVVAVALLAFVPASARGSVPAPVYAATIIGLTAWIAYTLYAGLMRVSDGAHLYGPYAVWAVAASLVGFVLVFAFAYWLPSEADGTCMNHALSRIDAAYFSLTTFTTTGFGDISPVTSECRAIASAQMAMTFALVALGLGVFVSRVSSGRPRI
jgi:hypothetical protein